MPFAFRISSQSLLKYLGLSSAVSILLLITRMSLSGNTVYLFLIWNLFLAWIPFWLSHTLGYIKVRGWAYLIPSVVLTAWLLFFPNAPYILTDFIHLKPRPLIPVWYDTILLSSFAMNGLLLASSSLWQVLSYIQHTVQKRMGLLSILTISYITGVGIYLGRVLRWNSWDIISHPMHIVVDTLEIFSLSQSSIHLQIRLILFSLIFSFFYLLCLKSLKISTLNISDIN